MFPLNSYGLCNWMTTSQTMWFNSLVVAYQNVLQQSHSFTVRLYCVHEKSLVSAFCWLARKIWYGLSASDSKNPKSNILALGNRSSADKSQAECHQAYGLHAVAASFLRVASVQWWPGGSEFFRVFMESSCYCYHVQTTGG